MNKGCGVNHKHDDDDEDDRRWSAPNKGVLLQLGQWHKLLDRQWPRPIQVLNNDDDDDGDDEDGDDHDDNGNDDHDDSGNDDHDDNGDYDDDDRCSPISWNALPVSWSRRDQIQCSS